MLQLFFIEQVLCMRLILGIVGSVTEWRSLCRHVAHSLAGQKKSKAKVLCKLSGA